jgi:hypothetical protein
MKPQRTAKEIILWALDKVAECLGPFVEKHFKRKGISLSSTTDPSVLLKAFAFQYHEVFADVLDKLAKTWAHELLEYRNRISHGEHVTDADAKRALDTAYRLCKAVGCERIAEEIMPHFPPKPKPLPIAPLPWEYYFWDEVLRRMREQGLTTTKQQTPRRSYLGLPSGKSHYTYCLAFNREGDFQVELYLDNDDKGLNERRFEDFKRRQKEIESELGTMVSWQKLEEKCACRIAVIRSVTDRETEREELIDWGIKMFVKMRNVFGPLIHEQVRLK